jgi:hypothetical protein
LRKKVCSSAFRRSLRTGRLKAELHTFLLPPHAEEGFAFCGELFRVDVIREQGEQLLFGLFNRSFVVRIGTEADFDLTHAGVEAEIDIFRVEVCLFQDRDDIGFADALGVDDTYKARAGIGIAILQPGDDFFGENGIEFVGRAGKYKKGLLSAQVDPLTRSSTDGIGKDTAVFKNKGLPLSGGRDGSSAFFVPPLEVVDRLFVKDDLPFKHQAKGITGDVVACRTQAAADKYEVNAA